MYDTLRDLCVRYLSWKIVIFTKTRSRWRFYSMHYCQSPDKHESQYHTYTEQKKKMEPFE